MKKPKSHYIGIYGAEVLIFFNWKDKDFIKYMKKYFNIDTDVVGLSGAHYCIANNEGHQFEIIFVRNNKDKYKMIGSFMHECIHAAFQILHDRGVLFDFKNQEAICYLADDIFESIVNKKNKSIK